MDAPQSPEESPQSPDTSGSYQAGVSETPQSPICRTTDKSGSYQAEVSDASHPVGARFIGREEGPPSPQALLGEWYTRYPNAFFKGHTRPLMVGIHELLASREPWPEKLVRRALACYVNLPRYLKAMRENAERIDLDGQPTGKVDAQAADYAHRKLDRLQGEKRAGKGRNSQARQQQRRGKATKESAKGKSQPNAKVKGDARQVASKGQGAIADSAPHQADVASSPSTMEEKLSALMAKHNGR
ncbi:ABC transporter substrate-binding protein [Halomonas sp. D1-1]|uniref:ABC transporter substrate-binding protein n=2 Tax=Halomonas icarae TaxID=2691040 RepID=A0A7X5AMN4_9GAMM|nr:ABC transporter substrate-binding protein [Halomonas icarae]